MDTDTINILNRFKREMETLIRKHAEEDVHWTGKQSEPEISENYVQQCTYEEIVEEGGALDELFDDLKDKIFDEVRCQKRQALIEAKEEEKYQAAHMPTSIG